jgi:hypothetical protein
MAESDGGIIDCWEPSNPDLSDYQTEICQEIAHVFRTLNSKSLERWFKKELSDALRTLIVDDGIVGISFDDQNNPILKFWAGGAQYDELTCSSLADGDGLAEELDQLIRDWASDIADTEVGLRNRAQLSRLRDVMLAAVDKIETALR